MDGISKKIYLELQAPTEDDNRSDQRRIQDGLKEQGIEAKVSLRVLRKLYPLCEEAEWKVTVSLAWDGQTWHGVDLEAGDTTGLHYGVAVDLGSTTVVARLVDCATGKILGETSTFNGQIPYGTDILTRIFHCQEDRGTLEILRKAAVTSITTCVRELEAQQQLPENSCIAIGMGDKNEIQSRVNQLKAQIAEEKSEFEKENLQERLAKIAGGVAVIGVGAATEVEMKDKKLRIEDALSATKAAVEEGIVAGGGTSYVNIIPKVEKVVESLKEDEKLGGKIILKALEEPVKQIAINAGLEPAVILEKVKGSNVGIGFDAANEEYVDMKKSGIVDPTKVSRSALQNAESIASMILTTESLVTDKKEPKECSCGGHDNAADMGAMY